MSGYRQCASESEDFGLATSFGTRDTVCNGSAVMVKSTAETKLSIVKKESESEPQKTMVSNDDGLDLEEVLSWTPYPNSTSEGKSDEQFEIEYDCNSKPLTKEEAEIVRGHIIVVEGGVGQGKSRLTTTISQILESLDITCRLEKEPVDHHALALFIKFQKLPEEGSVSKKQMVRLKEAKIRASEMMQFNMMRNRSECAVRTTETASLGGVGIMDRGPFGDAAFMNTTFSQAGVSPDMAMQYIIEFMRRYIKLGFPGKKMIILRLRASPETALTRWLEREKETKGNKYTIEYVKSLENAHDMCGVAWGKHFVYDNSNSPSPETAEYKASVNGLIRNICSKLREWDV